MKNKNFALLIWKAFVLFLLLQCFAGTLNSQTRGIAKVAVIQASSSPGQDPFMADYDPAMVRPQSEAHFNKLLDLFEQAGKMGADIVCGPENMHGTGAYGLHVDVTDPETYRLLTEPNPPILKRYQDIRLTTGDRQRQIEAVRKVDYGPGENKSP